MVKVLLAAVTITVVAGAGYVVATRGNDQNETQQTTTQEPSNSEQSETSANDPDQSGSENTDSETTAVSGWVLNETQFGNFYLPESEGGLTFVKQDDPYGVNGGHAASLVTYDVTFFDLSNPIIQFHGGIGYFGPCQFDFTTMNGKGVTINIPEDSSTFTTKDHDCVREKTSIGGREFLDVSSRQHHDVRNGFFTISSDKASALIIKDRPEEHNHSHSGCFDDNSTLEMCSDDHEQEKTKLRMFIEQFVEENPMF